MRAVSASRVQCDHDTLGRMFLEVEPGAAGPPPLLFTENESNAMLLFGSENASPYVKDSIGECVVAGRADAVNPARKGTKCAAHFKLELGPGEERSVRLRLRHADAGSAGPFGAAFEGTMAARRRESDEFHASLPGPSDPEIRRVARQANAGLLWSKQFYHYVVEDWLKGDANFPPPPEERLTGRNRDWPQIFSRDVISMPRWFPSWNQ